MSQVAWASELPQRLRARAQSYEVSPGEIKPVHLTGSTSVRSAREAGGANSRAGLTARRQAGTNRFIKSAHYISALESDRKYSS